MIIGSITPQINTRIIKDQEFFLAIYGSLLLTY